MTTPTFDTQAGVSKLRSAGVEEPAAQSIVEVVADATSPLLTRDMLTLELAQMRTDLYRALWIQGVGIVAVVGGIVGISQAVG